jgi:UDP-N-acetylglucosamine--N-acetylmuramyl-(pentapeptide) pyrophosphoryl-undecaprenol N-acetylglucosamine transferase
MSATSQTTYLFAGGGTGGHLYPGIAVAAELTARDEQARIVFAGSGRAVERDIVASSGYEHWQQGAEPLTVMRSDPWRFALGNWQAFRAAVSALRRERPAVVIGLGGFASAPLVLAAQQLSIPTVLLEQNVTPGRATRWLSRRASLVCLSFDVTRKSIASRGRVVVTGNPVRREIAALSEESAAATVTAPSVEPAGHETLLVLGGSQGAHGVNLAMVEAVDVVRAKLPGWSIVHQTGQNDAAEVAGAYDRIGVAATVSPFLNDLPVRYSTAAIAISRAGATTLAELACAGIPAILFPYPQAARDHQLQNARVFEAAGAACVIDEKNPTDTPGAVLAGRLRILLDDRAARENMSRAMRRLARPLAAVSVAEEILGIISCRNAPWARPQRSAG